MQFTVTKTEDLVTRVVITGRLDLDASLKLENPFAFQVATEGGPVVVDLSGVDFVASMGMRLIVKNARAVQNRGGKLVILATDPNVIEAFKLAGLAEIVPLYSTFEEASASALSRAAS
ncbi:MAG: STAS domain-containing protein [Opitutaceae bacterium]|nr:STAS domain-containing protein [Opitutaceae bacterium]